MNHFSDDPKVYQNPFELNKASDYSDKQVQDYWVDVEDLKLLRLLNLSSARPMFLLGGKGSGKTHLMRYCSSAVQELRHDSLRLAIESDGYVGIYTSIDGLNVHRFSGKGQSEEAWSAVFCYSFELWLAVSLLTSLQFELDREPEISARVESDIRAMVQLEGEGQGSISGLIDSLNGLRRHVDLIVNNAAIKRSLSGIEVGFTPGHLVYGIPKLLAKEYSFLSETMFIYLIDELENFTEQQQFFINTLIRYRKGPATLRVGSRINGVKTFLTLGAGEPIRRGAEFDVEVIDEVLRLEKAKYEKMAEKLVKRRIQLAGIDISLRSQHPREFFSEPDPTDCYREASLALVNGRDMAGQRRPHLARLERQLADVLSDAEEVARIVKNLSVADHPVLEKINIMIFLKRVSRGGDLIELSDKVAADCAAFRLGGRSASSSYYVTYTHFSSDIFAQLYRDYGKRPVYAGFRTLVRLSQGIPRNLLNLLKNIYRRSEFAGEDPFRSGVISVDAQTYGVQDSADWFWEDAQPDRFGSVVRGAVENVATLLRSIRYSDNPSECDLCSFLIALDGLAEDSIVAIRAAESWSFLIQVGTASGSKNDGRILYKYQVNPMLAARWGISGSRRGSVELSDELANTMFSSKGESTEVKQAIRARVDGMDGGKLLSRWKVAAAASSQGGLFNE
ncbi:hypothetical protein I5W42_18570 [Stenotrophomonas maltophilia]|nr:hypothetical protein [Stenotrophomonas maltophilia]